MGSLRRRDDNSRAKVQNVRRDSSAFSSLVAAAAPEGIILVYGALSKEENVFPAIQAIRKKLTMRGIASTGMLQNDLKPEALKSHVTSGLKSGDLRPTIAKTFLFDRIADAHRYIESGEQFGKVVLTV